MQEYAIMVKIEVIQVTTELLLEIASLMIGTILLMLAIRLVFCEIDARMALKRSNLAFFLNFDHKFKYRRLGSTIIILVICYTLVSFDSLFTKAGWVLFGSFLVMAIIADYLSSFVSHYYCRRRFKTRIAEVKEHLERLKRKIMEPTNEEDIYVPEEGYNFLNVVQRYIQDDDHMACFSHDGGIWFANLPRYSQVSFLVDNNTALTKTLFDETPIRLTTLTKNHRYPFKDHTIDKLICFNEDYQPNEALRVLKENGIVMINQFGSDNLQELRVFRKPRQAINLWNLEIITMGLQNQGFVMLDGQEERNEIRFRSLASFFAYIKPYTLIKLEEIEKYINQFFFVDQVIQKNGYFAMKTHRFYVVGRKMDPNDSL